ncbi:MAG TPA: XrtA system polysaccharide chain length determinant [Candidatus Competibacteraceae bacterium]|nr:XrtA system polysaccharide chain length determinant [Candidatus Competibacteraceae bacterium]
MHKGFAELLGHVEAVWRYRWYMLLTATMVCVLGWGALFVMPDTYRSEAKIYLDTQTILKPLLRGLAVDSNIAQQTALLMRRTLLSRPHLEKVIRETGLREEATTPQQMEELLRRLTDKITVDGSEVTNIYTIAYQHSSPQVARDVVERLVNLFLVATQEAERADSDKAQRFLEDQIEEYKVRLEGAEARLEEFKRQNVGLMPEQGRTYFEQITIISRDLRTAEMELREAENRRDELRQQLKDVQETVQDVGEGSDGALGPLDERIHTMESRLDELLLQYTEQHPDVISTRDTLAQLREARQQQVQQLQRGGNPAILVQSPVYQELKVALGTAEADVAARRVRVAEFQGRLTELQQLVDTIPKVEAELAKLNRDYEVNKENYAELVRRRESAKISDKVGNNPDNTQFKIIEPPELPQVPVSPKRSLLATAVLLGGLGAGAALAWLLGQGRPTFRDWRSLREFTGLPVLGSVTRVVSPMQTLAQRAELLAFGLACLGLLALYAGVIVLPMMQAERIAALLAMLQEALR